MAGSINKVILIGNLGADPEVRHTQDGRAIVNLRLATTEFWRDKQSGERREKTEWHSVVIFDKFQGEVAQKFAQKGSKLYIEGQLQTRKWQDNSGNDRYTTEVVVPNYGGKVDVVAGGKKNNGSDDSRFEDSGGAREQDQPKEGSSGGGKRFDDEIPF